MKLTGVTTQQSFLPIEPLKPDLKLPLGQIIEAKINAKLSQNLFELLINNQTVKVKTKEPFEPGQRLQLVAEKNKAETVLRSLTAPKASSTESTTKQQLNISRAQLLRQSLPQEASFKPLVKTLTQLLTKTTEQTSFPKALGQSIKNVFDSFTTAEKLVTKEGFKQAIKQSGLFLEAQLAKTEGHVKTDTVIVDTKSNLLKLSNLLAQFTQQGSTLASQQKTGLQLKPPQNIKNSSEFVSQTKPSNANNNTVTKNHSVIEFKQALSPLNIPVKPLVKQQQPQSVAPLDLDVLPDIKELLQQVDQSLNRIQSHQSNAVAIEKHELPVWTMDIPIKDGKQLELLSIAIHKDSNGNKHEQGDIWNIQLNLEFESLGKIHAKLSLYGQEVMASLWADKNGTRELIQNHLAELEGQLTKVGLNVACIQCLKGTPPETINIPKQNGLVDLHL